MIRLNQLSIMQEFTETIPKAAKLGRPYLKALWANAVALELPMTLAVDDLIQARQWKAEPIKDCLVATPTNPKLKKYPIAHFATEFGSMLRVGWYQLGGDYTGGQDVGELGLFHRGVLTDVQAHELESLHTSMHRYAVLPAIQSLLRGSEVPRGMFGA